MGKNFLDFFHEADADVFCLQGDELQAGQIDLDLPGIINYWNYARKKGYSGTALFTKKSRFLAALRNWRGEHMITKEEPLITAEFPEYYVITCYTPNSQNEACQTGLPYGVGGCVARLFKRPGRKEAGYFLRVTLMWRIRRLT